MIKIKLKAVLADREMTQTKLSELTGVRISTISAICTGSIKELPVRVIDKICETLDCNPGDWIKRI